MSRDINDEKGKPRVDLQEERSRKKQKEEKDCPAGSGLGLSEDSKRSPRAESASRGKPPRILVEIFDLNSKCSGKI